MAQSIHAAFLFAKNNPTVTSQWLNDSQYLIVVSVANEHDLLGVVEAAKRQNLDYCLWAEPDLGNEYTALTLSPGLIASKLCANLPLAGKTT